jgi:L-lactate dehydrogenase complex protein LldG
MSEARAAILARVRSSLADAPTREPDRRSYRRVGGRPRSKCVELFSERVGSYQATVARVADVAGAVTEECVRAGAMRMVISSGLPARWRPPGITLVEDDGLSARELDKFDGVITGCTVAIAETGTVVLSAAPAEGRRAITLVPDLHVCIVEETQIVELLPEAIARLEPIIADTGRPITFISGPSATSDIELSRVEGVHGPRKLVVLVAEENP